MTVLAWRTAAFTAVLLSSFPRQPGQKSSLLHKALNEDGRCFELESVDGSAVSSTQVLTQQLSVPASGTLVTASTRATKKVGIHCGTEL